MNCIYRNRMCLVLLLMLAVSMACARVVTEAEARQTAMKFVKPGGARSIAQQPMLVCTEGAGMGTDGLEPAYYVYNYGKDGGFVIVAGDDCLPAVLAFSEQGTFEPKELPSQVSAWLDGYKATIRASRAGTDWPVPAPELGKEIVIDVQPLLKSRWNQAKPYNNLCPSAGGERAATGCAATAIAQIMKYHQWPDRGMGSNTHLGQYVDFSQSVYEWEKMRDTYVEGTYSEDEAQAVAKLMSDVGNAVWMQYDYASAAQNAHIYRALYTHFKYSKKAQYVLRNTMTTAEWKRLIRQELEAGRPVYYSGLSDDLTMGHAFVCDGIDQTGNYLHFNWGWSGNCDGFYYLNMLNPPNPGIGGGQGNFNADHTVIIGIEPCKGDESGWEKQPVLALLQYFQTLTSRTSLGKTFKTTAYSVWNFGPEQSRCHLAVALYRGDDIVRTVSENLPLNVDEFKGVSDISLQVTIPETTAPGDYELRLVKSVDGVTGWEELLAYHDAYRCHIPLTIEGNSVIIRPVGESEVQLGVTPREEMPEILMPGSDYVTTFKVANLSEQNFSGTMCCRVKRLADVVGNQPSFLPKEPDTTLVMQTEWRASLYSEDVQSMPVTYNLDKAGNYLLEICYTDPVSLKYRVAGVWKLKVDSPLIKNERKTLVELVAGGEMEKTDLLVFAQDKEHVVPVVVEHGAWIDSLALSEGTSMAINRMCEVKQGELQTVWEGLTDKPVVASVEMKATFADEEQENIRLAVHTTFAYAADQTDMRIAVVALKEKDGLLYLSESIPGRNFNGEVGSLPLSVEAGKRYTYETIVKKVADADEKNYYMALLVDNTTGEVRNVALCGYGDLTGGVKPSSVAFDRTRMRMNVGVQAPLVPSVTPAWTTAELEWSSSQPSVAKVDAEGVVTTLSEGVTEIRVSSVKDASIGATIEVCVEKVDFAHVLQVSAGELCFWVNAEVCPEALKLAGELNGTDIALLRSLSSMHSLDISQCRIVAGGEAYAEDYYTEADIIGPAMFKDCKGLVKVVLPEGTVSIGNNAFMGCEMLASIAIPASVKSIGYACFAGCNGLESFVVSEKNREFKAWDGVLYNYAGTELVAYPAGSARECYTAIETLNVIRPFAFYGAAGLKGFVGNLRLSSVGYAAFCQSGQMQRVELGNRVGRIDEYAFAGCGALTKIVCRKNYPPECVADNVFDGVQVGACAVYVPEDYIEDYRQEVGWRLFANYGDVADGIELVAGAPGDDVHLYAEDRGAVRVFSVTAGIPIQVYGVDGMLVKQAQTVEGEVVILLPRPGLYIVKMPDSQIKVLVK